MLDPGALERMVTLFRKPFDGRDRAASDLVDWRLTRANGFVIEQDGACAAQPTPAPVFRPQQPDRVAQHPQKRGARKNVDLDGSPIDRELHARKATLQRGSEQSRAFSTERSCRIGQ